MKRIFFVAILFFFLQGAVALSTDMNEVYRPSETVIAKMSGVILSSITPENMRIIKNNLEVAVNYDLKRINGEYYFWFVAPQTEGAYQMIVEDIITMSAGAQVTVDFVENFSVSGELIDYNVNPGFVVSSGNFEIGATLYEDENKEITLSFPTSRSVTLRPGINELDFSTASLGGTQFLTINFGQYSIPALLTGQNASANSSQNFSNGTMPDSNVTNNSTNATQNQTNTTVVVYYEPKFKFLNRLVRGRVLVSGEIPSYEIILSNYGEDVEGIFLDYDRDAFLIQPDRDIFIGRGKNKSLELKFLRDERENFRDAIIAYKGNYSDYMRFSIEFTENETAVGVDSFDGENSEIFYCAELGGRICLSEQVCDGEIKDAQDGKCCLAQCKQEEPTSYSWIGYLLAAVLIVVVAIIYSKYKKTKGSGRAISNSMVGKI